MTAMSGMDYFGFAMSIGLSKDAFRPIFFMDSLYFTGDDSGGLIPGDSDIPLLPRF